MNKLFLVLLLLVSLQIPAEAKFSPVKIIKGITYRLRVPLAAFECNTEMAWRQTQYEYYWCVYQRHSSSAKIVDRLAAPFVFTEYFLKESPDILHEATLELIYGDR